LNWKGFIENPLAIEFRFLKKKKKNFIPILNPSFCRIGAKQNIDSNLFYRSQKQIKLSPPAAGSLKLLQPLINTAPV